MSWPQQCLFFEEDTVRAFGGSDESFRNRVSSEEELVFKFDDKSFRKEDTVKVFVGSDKSFRNRMPSEEELLFKFDDNSFRERIGIEKAMLELEDLDGRLNRERRNSEPLSSDRERRNSEPLTSDRERRNNEPLTSDRERRNNEPLTSDRERRNNEPLTSDRFLRGREVGTVLLGDGRVLTTYDVGVHYDLSSSSDSEEFLWQSRPEKKVHFKSKDSVIYCEEDGLFLDDRTRVPADCHPVAQCLAIVMHLAIICSAGVLGLLSVGFCGGRSLVVPFFMITEPMSGFLLFDDLSMRRPMRLTLASMAWSAFTIVWVSAFPIADCSPLWFSPYLCLGFASYDIAVKLLVFFLIKRNLCRE